MITPSFQVIFTQLLHNSVKHRILHYNSAHTAHLRVIFQMGFFMPIS